MGTKLSVESSRTNIAFKQFWLIHRKSFFAEIKAENSKLLKLAFQGQGWATGSGWGSRAVGLGGAV